mmetsp:Transcript_58953/g.127538  ORF Transcript_58953/g.127538 Transcript_58953/m.127538 type:complete len:546 (-) Transcript_58953:123-1760(-)
MAKTSETGQDYVKNVAQEFQVLQENVATLQIVVSQLRSDLELEQTARDEAVSALKAEIANAVSMSEEMNSSFTARADDFEAKTKQWVGSLGKESMASKAHLANLDAAVAERAAQHAATSDKVQALEQRADEFEPKATLWVDSLREDCTSMNLSIKSLKSSEKDSIADRAVLTQRVIKIEEILPNLKSSLIAAEEKLGSKLGSLQNEVANDRAAAAAAVRAATGKAAHDLQMAGQRIDSMQYEINVNKKSASSENANLSARLQELDALVQTKAKAIDVQALDLRMRDSLDRAILGVKEELSKKATTISLNALSEKTTALAMDVRTNQLQGKAEVECIHRQLETLEGGMAKTNRQLDTDRERSSACCVALEKEVAAKASKDNLEALSSKVRGLEEAVAPLAPALGTKASQEDLIAVRARTEALESMFPNKADAADLAKVHLSMADHAAKHDAHLRWLQDNGTRIEKLDTQLQEHHGKIEATESRTTELQSQMKSKADAELVHTREVADMKFHDYYRREEVDAMMSRIWWRVGDLSKTSKVVSLSARG